MNDGNEPQKIMSMSVWTLFKSLQSNINYTEYSNSDISPNLINPRTSISMIEPRLLHGANCLSLEATYLLRVSAISTQHTPRLAHPASNRDGQASV